MLQPIRAILLLKSSDPDRPSNNRSATDPRGNLESVSNNARVDGLTSVILDLFGMVMARYKLLANWSWEPYRSEIQQSALGQRIHSWLEGFDPVTHLNENQLVLSFHKSQLMETVCDRLKIGSSADNPPG